MYHGISAYNRSGKIHDLIRRAEILPTVSACYADRPIGPIGVFCDISHADRVDYIAEHDVWSYVDADGRRQIADNRDNQDVDICYPPPGADLSALYDEYSRKADSVRRYRRYAEISAVAHPAAIWVDCSFGKIWVKRARVVARRLGLTLMYVKSIR